MDFQDALPEKKIGVLL